MTFPDNSGGKCQIFFTTVGNDGLKPTFLSEPLLDIDQPSHANAWWFNQRSIYAFLYVWNLNPVFLYGLTASCKWDSFYSAHNVSGIRIKFWCESSGSNQLMWLISFCNRKLSHLHRANIIASFLPFFMIKETWAVLCNSVFNLK